MGCHTWFYRKIEAPITKEEFKERVKNYLEGYLQAYNDYKKGLPSHIVGIDSALIEQQISRVTDGLQSLDEGDIFEKYWENLKEDSDIVYYEGFFYRDTNQYWDIFRNFKYPEVQLTSFEEAWEYYTNPKNKCVVYSHEDNKYYLPNAKKELDEEVKERLKKFFQEEGLILFN